MMITEEAVKLVQNQLTSMGLYTGPEDGIPGVKTYDALNEVDWLPQKWSNGRKAIAFIQTLAQRNGIETGEIDGYWGPQTDFAFVNLNRIIRENRKPVLWRPEELDNKNPNNWPSQIPENSIIQFYGEVGTHQTEIRLPYPHRISWQPEKVINSYRCHEKVRESLSRILSKVLEHYRIEGIRDLGLDLWGGCLNVRKKRGGSTYSMHSWGIAVDYNPDRNRLEWGRDRAVFAKPEYYEWWKAWEDEGWVSLGRTRNFDWMHIQAAKI